MEMWLRDRLEAENVPGLRWTDKQKRQFCVPEKHFGRRDVRDSDDAIYRVFKHFGSSCSHACYTRPSELYHLCMILLSGIECRGARGWRL